MRKILLLVLAISSSMLTYSQFITAGDDASNYATWSNGDNNGFGLNPWALGTTGNAGFFLASSAADGFGDIDVSSKSFGMYGNTGAGDYSVASRGVNNWSDGAVYTVDLAIAYRNGHKGFNIYSTGNNQILNFDVTGDLYKVEGADLGWGYDQASIFNLKIVQNGVDVDITLTRGADVYSITVTGKTLESVGFYVGNTGNNTLDNLYINNLKIEYTTSSNVPSAADVIIDGAAEIGISETLTCNNLAISGGTLTIKSTSGGTGSLITNGVVTGSVNIERYIPGYSKGNGFHLLSSPVTSQAISDFDGIGGTDDFYKWDETANGGAGVWDNRTEDDGSEDVPFEDNFQVARGYLVGYSGNVTKTFTGTLNNSDVAIADLTNTDGDGNHGWNLIGNPFASPVQWNNVSWGLSGDVGGTAKYFDEASSGNYLDISNNDFIPAMQGFFVQQTILGTGSLTIPKSARSHTGNTWTKDNNEYVNTLKLKVSGGVNTYWDLTRINVNDAAAETFDIEFDSHKMFGDAAAPQLFTKMGEEKYSTNSFNLERSNKTIDLAFRAGTDGEHTIEVVLNTLDIADDVYLEDLVENITIDLSKTSTYTFNATTEDNENRFKLHFGATGIEDIASTSLQAYMSGNNLMIIGEEGQAQLSIFDIQGKQVLAEQVELTTDFRKALNLPTGIYVIRVQTNEVIKTNKVIIK